MAMKEKKSIAVEANLARELNIEKAHTGIDIYELIRKAWNSYKREKAVAPKPAPADIASAIREVRTAKGWRKVDLAQHLLVSPAAIEQWESTGEVHGSPWSSLILLSEETGSEDATRVFKAVYANSRRMTESAFETLSETRLRDPGRCPSEIRNRGDASGIRSALKEVFGLIGMNADPDELLPTNETFPSFSWTPGGMGSVEGRLAFFATVAEQKDRSDLAKKIRDYLTADVPDDEKDYYWQKLVDEAVRLQSDFESLPGSKTEREWTTVLLRALRDNPARLHDATLREKMARLIEEDPLKKGNVKRHYAAAGSLAKHTAISELRCLDVVPITVAVANNLNNKTDFSWTVIVGSNSTGKSRFIAGMYTDHLDPLAEMSGVEIDLALAAVALYRENDEERLEILRSLFKRYYGKPLPPPKASPTEKSTLPKGTVAPDVPRRFYPVETTETDPKSK